MGISAPGIVVGTATISADDIDKEVQYHPARALAEARYAAMQALVIRQLLLQRGEELGLFLSDFAGDEEGVIAALLDRELTVPKAGEEDCRTWYRNNPEKFFSSPLFEVSHILYLAPPDDPAARGEAKERAEKAIAALRRNPDSFEEIARAESACSSREHGGHLGQVARGQTVPGFEKALSGMKAGETSGEPVGSEVGFHVIRVHRREEGRLLDFSAVRGRIADDLEGKSWARAFHQYIQLLAGRTKISGFRFQGGAADTPLVQ